MAKLYKYKYNQLRRNYLRSLSMLAEHMIERWSLNLPFNHYGKDLLPAQYLSRNLQPVSLSILRSEYDDPLTVFHLANPTLMQRFSTSTFDLWFLVLGFSTFHLFNPTPSSSTRYDDDFNVALIFVLLSTSLLPLFSSYAATTVLRWLCCDDCITRAHDSIFATVNSARLNVKAPDCVSDYSSPR